VIGNPDGTKANLLGANFCLKIRYLKKSNPVATRLQFVRQRNKRVYVTGNRRADNAEVSQWPGDRKGG
jgi:collagenase-like PrtC family protease